MLDDALLMLLRGSTGLALDRGNRAIPIEERVKDPAGARRSARQRLRALTSTTAPRTTRFPPARQDGTLVATHCS